MVANAIQGTLPGGSAGAEAEGFPLATWLKRWLHWNCHKTAIVFGPEDAGLSNEDISICNWLMFIKIGEKFYSLNLSHAVAVVMYPYNDIDLVRSISFFDVRDKQDDFSTESIEPNQGFVAHQIPVKVKQL